MISPYLLFVAIFALSISAIAKRSKFQSELLILIVAAAVSFIPVLPHFVLDGHTLLEFILPPLLFSAARHLSVYKFSRMRIPIVSLGVILVFVTAFAVAFFVSQTVGFMTLSAGLVLGAVIAPPDAVSAVSIGQKLHLPDRIMTILTGESLINDAAALTLFSFAISRTFAEESFIRNPYLLFLYTSVIGALIGVLFAVLALLIRKLLKDSALIAVFTLLVPFCTYIGAEQIHASGVMAVVFCGFVIERGTWNANYSTRLQETSIWRSVETLLESFVFAYIGLQVRFIISDLMESRLNTSQVLFTAVFIFLITLTIRPLWIFGYNFVRRRLRAFMSKHISRYKPSADGVLSWRECVILGWTGMRGVVTLAAASAVPTVTIIANGTVTVGFQMHVFIQVVGLVVAVGTLILQGLTLPFLIKRLLPQKDDKEDPLDGQWRRARAIMEQAAYKIIEQESAADPDNVNREKLEKVWRSLQAERIGKNKRDITFVSRLLSEIVEQQREDIILAVADGDLHPDVAKEYLTKLDHKQASYSTKEH